MYIRNLLLFTFLGLTLSSQGQRQPHAQIKKTQTTPQKEVKDLHSIDYAQNQRMFIDAERLKILGQYQGAIDLFVECVNAEPENSAALFELARLYYASKLDDKALLCIEQAVKISPNNLWFNLVYAQVLVAKEQDKEAIGVYDKILELEPHEIDYYYDKAQLYERTNQTLLAIAEYDLIERTFGIDEYPIDQKKRLYLSINQIDKAVSEAQKLIDDAPNNPDYYNSIAELYTANKEVEKAKKIYQEMLVKFPDYPFALLAMADFSYQSGDKAAAIAYTVKAFANKKMNIDKKIKILYQYIQFANTKKSEINDAFQLADALVAAHPNDAKSYAIYADLYQSNNNDSMALVYYEKSIALKNNVYAVWQQLFFVSSELQAYGKLKSSAEKAIELFPSEPLPYFFNAVACDHFKYYDTAVFFFQKALKLCSANNALKAQILASLGDTYHNMKLNAASDSCYVQAIKLDPSNAYAMNNYSYYLSLRNEYLEKAKEYSSMSNSIDKSNASYMDTYAWILYQLKEYKSAKEWQEKALRTSNLSDPLMFEHYGDILYRLGDIDNAVKSWIKAKEKGAKSEQLNKKIADKKLNE